MLRYSFNLDKEADAIEKAVELVLEDGYRTIDLMSSGHSDELKNTSCSEMGDLIAGRITDCKN